MTGRQFAILTALALTWGCSFLFIKVIVEAGVDPMGMSALRTLLGVLTLVPFAWRARSGFRQPRNVWLAMVGLGILNFAIPWTLFGSPRPLSNCVSAVALRRCRFGRVSQSVVEAAPSSARASCACWWYSRVCSCSCRGCSESLATTPANRAHFPSTSARYLFMSIRRGLQIPPLPLATVQLGTAAACLMPSAILTGAFSGAEFDGRVVANIVMLGALGSGLAVVAMMYLIQNVGPVRASVVTYMVPPVGVFLGWLLLDEAIGWNLIAALALLVLCALVRS